MTDEQPPDPQETVGYGSEIQEILTTPVTATNIHGYAETALRRLIGIVESAVNDYLEAETNDVTAQTEKELEDDALRYFGLPEMGHILEHIGELDEAIGTIDDVLEEVDTTYEVLTPPDTAFSPNIQAADGSYSPAEVRELTELVLLVLNQEYGIDVSSQAALTIVRGSVTPHMMRQQPYYLIVAPGLNRTILLCDESRNATFVFDTQGLEQLGISPETLGLKTKPELKALMQDHPGLGKWLAYTGTFVGRFAAAIKNLDIPGSSQGGERGGRYLVPDSAKPTSINVAARKIQTSAEFVEMAVNELGGSLGNINYVLFEGELVANFSDEQLDLMRDWLRALALNSPLPPVGYKARNTLAAEIHVTPEKLRVAAQTIADFGEPGIFRIPDKPRPAMYYSPKQQDQLLARLRGMGVAVDASGIPEGVATIERLVGLSGKNRKVVTRTIAALKQQLGPVKPYIVPGSRKKAMGFDETQTALILGEIEHKADQLTLKEAADELEVGVRIAQNAVRATAGKLGSLEYVTRGRHQTPTYNRAQRQILRDWITARGYYRQLPEGTLSLPAYAATRHLGHAAVAAFIAEQVKEGRIPEPDRHPFGPKGSTYAITPKLQSFLNDNLPPGIPRPYRQTRESEK